MLYCPLNPNIGLDLLKTKQSFALLYLCIFDIDICVFIYSPQIAIVTLQIAIAVS